MDLLWLGQPVIAVSQVYLLSLASCQALVDVRLQMPLELLNRQVMKVLHFVESKQYCYKL